MPVDSCLFAVHVADPGLAHDAMRRARALVAFYSPLGLTEVTVERPTPHLVVGTVAARPAPPPGPEPAVWGEPLPASLAAGELLDASDSQLRTIAGMTAAVAAGGARARIVASSFGPATLYEAEGDGVWACSTHAVAAGVLAGVELAVDPEAVALHVAFDCVPGERTLLRGIATLPPAACIDIDGSARGIRTYATSAERWAPVPESTAYDHTARALPASLDQRSARRHAALALTAGLDSRVGAAALASVGRSPRTFTWGDPAWPDAQGAAATAAALGLEHEVLGTGALSDTDVLARLDADARWTDGVTALTASERVWPPHAELVAVGMGGETGRAFHYDAWSALSDPDPSSRTLADRFAVSSRLEDADSTALAVASAAVDEWLRAARPARVDGWRVLDVVYADQRVRRWGRSQVPCAPFDYVPLFTAPDVQRGLVSLPLEERLTSGFHRRFLEDAGLSAGPPPELPAPPGRARRLYWRARGVVRPPCRASADAVDTFAKALWDERPAARDWLVEDALRDALVTDVLGRRWAERVAEGFLAGRAHASERARLAAGPVALSRALRELPAPRSTPPPP